MPFVESERFAATELTCPMKHQSVGIAQQAAVERDGTEVLHLTHYAMGAAHRLVRRRLVFGRLALERTGELYRVAMKRLSS